MTNLQNSSGVVSKPKTLKTVDGETIAYHQSPGKGPGIIWCGGLKSDMDGGKATRCHAWARAQGRPYLRFDYFGHGQSSGQFTQGCISRWKADALYVLDQLTAGPQILIGSSMGGWVSLLTALARPDRIRGLLLIAPAPDFTQKLMWPNFSAEIQSEIMERGIYYEPSEYGEPMEITKTLIEDGAKNLIMDAPIELDIPVHILQGQKDDPVPWEHAQSLVEIIQSEQVEFTLVKDGDHRLSEEVDLIRMTESLDRLCRRVEGV